MAKVTLKTTEYPIVKKIVQSEYPKKVKISQKQIKVKINETLPIVTGKQIGRAQV